MIKAIISISFFVVITLTSLGQVLVTITNQEIDAGEGFTLVYETDSMLFKSQNLQTTKSFVVDTSKFKKLTISHVGYFDTTILSKYLYSFNYIALRKNFKLLETIVVRTLKEFSHSDLKTKKRERLNFSLSSINDWCFTIELPDGTSKLKSFKVIIKNLLPNDTLVFKLYNNEVSVLNSEPFFSNSIFILDKKTNLVDILHSLNENLDVEKSFILSVSNHSSRKDISSYAMILTKFKIEETQIYYQSRKNELYKYPMQESLKNFGGYPHLASEITYLK